MTEQADMFPEVHDVFSPRMLERRAWLATVHWSTCQVNSLEHDCTEWAAWLYPETYADRPVDWVATHASDIEDRYLFTAATEDEALQKLFDYWESRRAQLHGEFHFTGINCQKPKTSPMKNNILSAEAKAKFDRATNLEEAWDAFYTAIIKQVPDEALMDARTLVVLRRAYFGGAAGALQIFAAKRAQNKEELGVVIELMKEMEAEADRFGLRSGPTETSSPSGE